MEVRHPKIVAVLDVVVTDREVAVASEYVDAQVLSMLMRRAAEKRSPLPANVALRIGVDLLQALRAAHGAWGETASTLGLYGGLNPDSVMVATYGDVMLGDLGIASVLSAAHHTRQLADAVAYCAPEQLAPNAVANEQTDVFTIGVLLWELLVNRPLFGTLRGAQDPATVAERVRAAVVTRIDAVERQGPPIPGPMVDLVARALERNPAGRFGSLDALLGTLLSHGRGVVGTPEHVVMALDRLARSDIEARRASLASLTGGSSFGERESVLPESGRPTRRPPPPDAPSEIKTNATPALTGPAGAEAARDSGRPQPKAAETPPKAEPPQKPDQPKPLLPRPKVEASPAAAQPSPTALAPAAPPPKPIAVDAPKPPPLVRPPAPASAVPLPKPSAAKSVAAPKPPLKASHPPPPPTRASSGGDPEQRAGESPAAPQIPPPPGFAAAGNSPGGTAALPTFTETPPLPAEPVPTASAAVSPPSTAPRAALGSTATSKAPGSETSQSGAWEPPTNTAFSGPRTDAPGATPDERRRRARRIAIGAGAAVGVLVVLVILTVVFRRSPDSDSATTTAAEPAPPTEAREPSAEPAQKPSEPAAKPEVPPEPTTAEGAGAPPEAEQATTSGNAAEAERSQTGTAAETRPNTAGSKSAPPEREPSGERRPPKKGYRPRGI
jgi:serine/threonine protein kinase